MLTQITPSLSIVEVPHGLGALRGQGVEVGSLLDGMSQAAQQGLILPIEASDQFPVSMVAVEDGVAVGHVALKELMRVKPDSAETRRVFGEEPVEAMLLGGLFSQRRGAAGQLVGAVTTAAFTETADIAAVVANANPNSPGTFLRNGYHPESPDVSGLLGLSTENRTAFVITRENWSARQI